MNRHSFHIIVIFLISLLMTPMAVYAQQLAPVAVSVPPSAAAPIYTPEQLDQLLAPIALYPDPLVGQILMASTYPLEVVEAYRWRQNPVHASLMGNQLVAALQPEPWDPSVKSLVAFPQILKILNDNLQWTEQLGDVFLAQQVAVMDSIQRLRQRAILAGTLTSTPQQIVSTQGPDVIIEPASTEVIYVPVYNPVYTYGVWPYPSYPPYYFSDVAYVGTVIGFGTGLVIVDDLWGWNRWDWLHHRIDIDDHRFSELNHGMAPSVPGVWQHNPDHRRGVPYRDAATRARFENASSPETRRNYRGYMESGPEPVSMPKGPSQAAAPVRVPERDLGITGFSRAPAARAAQSPSFTRPISPPSAPVFESFSRGSDVRAQSARGAYSRSTMPAANMSRSASPAPVSMPHVNAGRGGSNNIRR